MIALATHDLIARPTWQEKFVQLLPRILRRASWALRRWRAQEREEATAEIVAHATLAYARLARRGRERVATATTLVGFALRHLRAGRRVGCRMNTRDVMSLFAQRRHQRRIEGLDQFDPVRAVWREVVVEDRHVGPAETAIARLDLDLWLASLPGSLRRLAEALASGERPGQAAQVLGVSPGRVSQFRAELRRSWEAFQGADRPTGCAA